MNNKIPVTIISGFLGSGKTTFLNHVLSNNEGIKFAIVENEFGSINIDQELIASKDDDIVEMTNGCICCEIKEDLIKSLVNLLQKKHSIDHLLIETTGVADDLSPEFNTMTTMRFPDNLRSKWGSRHEETLHGRANHQSHQAA
ncbi:GTP-binding protein [Neptuniibacter sp.]|uniref:CobW family GTP-binding protein n=1 Tax=Neptuniibacter sp. TaxID=1962643 RepID=UPI00261AE820|nr:GTP-binding protein [Neptuniibacter sp.]